MQSFAKNPVLRAFLHPLGSIPSLLFQWETVRCRLKLCLEGLLNLKEPIDILQGIDAILTRKTTHYLIMDLKRVGRKILRNLTQLVQDLIQDLVGKRTAQKDAIKDITSDSQVNSYFPYKWSSASLTFLNIYFYLFLYLYILSNNRKLTVVNLSVFLEHQQF